MLLINLLLLISAPNDMARDGLFTGFNDSAIESYGIKMIHDESNAHMYVVSENSDSSPSPIESDEYFHDKSTLDDHLLITTSNLDISILPRPIFSGNPTLNSERGSVPDNDPTTVFGTEYDHPYPEDVILINRPLDTQRWIPSFRMEGFSQLGLLATTPFSADATYSQIHIESQIENPVFVSSSDWVDELPQNESHQIDRHKVFRSIDHSGWSNDQGMSRREMRSDSHIDIGKDNSGPPGEISGLVATSGGPDRINISWVAPTNTGGSGFSITGYRIQIIKGSEAIPVNRDLNQTSTSYTDTGLDENVRYCYNIAALNDDTNVDDPSQHVGPFLIEPVCTTTTKVAPGVPTATTATAGGPSSIVLNWTAPLNNGGDAITGYKIEVSSNGTTGWRDLEDDTESTSTTFTHTGLSAETRQYYRVSAINTIGTGSPSQVFNATTTTATAPDAPTELSATAQGGTRITLSWSAPTNTGGASISGYKIEVSPNGNSNSWTDLETNTGSTETSYNHDGLMISTTRHYRVSAINSQGTSTASAPASATTTNVVNFPDAPTSLAATVNGLTVTLSWTAPDNTGGEALDGYIIWTAIGDGPLEIVEQNTGSLATTYTHTGLLASTQYSYRVGAVNSRGTSVPSDEVTVTTAGISVPGNPTSLTATPVGASIINLSWAAPASNGGAEISGYKIEVSPNENSDWEDLEGNTGSTQTSYSHTGLDQVTLLYYRVSAINSVGTSGTSNVASAVTDLATVPGAPTNLSATAGGASSITLSWTAPSNTGGVALSGYKIEASPNGNSGWTDVESNTGSTSTSHTHNGLTASTTYHYRVSAINSVGTGAASTTASATTTSATVPGAPTNLSATAGGASSITLSWTAPSNTGGVALSGYKIEASPNGNSGWTDVESNTGSTSTSHTHNGLTASTTYHYRVSAINSVGTGAASTTASATTTSATVPGAPTNLSATAGGASSITLSWTAPSNTGGVALSGYKIEASPNGNSGWTDVESNTGSTGTSYPHNGLTASTTYHYRVSAINSVGTGATSTTASATTTSATVPGAPTGLSADPGGATSITLSWTAPTNTGGVVISGYQIEFSLNGTSGWTDVESNTGSTGTSYPHNGLTASTTYHYRVSAINSVGTGSASTTANATTDAMNATRPQPPASLSATATGRSSINLSWTAPSDNGGSSISAYQIEVSLDGTSGWTSLVENTGSTSTSYEHAGLTASSTRHYRVSARNSIGLSDPSNIISATTDPLSAPNVPSVLSATAVGGTIINLAWTAPSDDGGVEISGYKIEVSPDGTSSWTDLVDNTNSAAVSYSHTGLIAGTTRYYRVSAINSVGTSSPSNVANATTESETAPSAPTGLSATALGPTSISLSWTAPLDDGGTDITAYLIEVSLNGTSGWTSLVGNTGTTETSYTHTGLTALTTQYYRVSAINSGGTGSASNIASATTSSPTVADAPSSLTATSTGTTTINLSWTAPIDDGGSAISGYRIELSSDGTASSWSNLISNTSSQLTSYTDNTLQPDMTRYYRISAINSVGVSSPSNTAFATTSDSSNLNFSGSVNNQFYPVGLPIKDLILPMVTGGTPPYSYTYTVNSGTDLPAELKFDPATRTISGTPSEITEAKTLIFTVTDAEGDTATLQFSITVYKISFEMMVDDQIYSRGQMIESLVLPKVSDGIDPIQYSLTPLDSLPVGLRFDLSARTVAGIPQQVASPVEFTFKAEDKNGAQDSLKFSIEVISPVHSQRETGLPQDFMVHANYPNPFVSSTTLVLDLPHSAQILIDVIDITGRRIYSNPPITMTAGWDQQIALNDLTLPAGHYFYRLTTTSLEGSSASSVHVGQFMSVQ